MFLVLSCGSLARDSSLALEHWKRQNLTSEEQIWLAKQPVIIHGTLDNITNMPFEFTDSEGDYDGLTADYIKLLSEKLGITFISKVREQKRKALLNKLENNEINIITYIHKPINSILNNAVFTEAIINMPIVLLGRNNSPVLHGIESLTDERVIVQKNTHAHKRIQIDHPHLKLQNVKTVREGIEYVSQGKADIFIHNAFSIEYEQRLYDLKGVKVVSGTTYNYPIYFAISQSMKPLVNVINKAIADISRTEKRLIFDKWVNIKINKRIDSQSIIKIVATFLLLIAFITLLFTYWNRKLASEVTNRTAELRDLARYLDNIREQEKAKLARDMHDELGHSLTSLIVGIKRLLTMTTEQKSIDKINELNELVLSASKTSKKIMTDLRPSVLEDLGLVAAIDWLANEFTQQHNITCTVNARDLPFKLSDETAIAMFRIVQEALTNVAKHARANQVNVTITFDQSALFLAIIDDGIGFNSNENTKHGCYGLKGMKERVLALGGQFHLTSEPNQGVKLSVNVTIDGNIIKE